MRNKREPSESLVVFLFLFFFFEAIRESPPRTFARVSLVRTGSPEMITSRATESGKMGISAEHIASQHRIGLDWQGGRGEWVLSSPHSGGRECVYQTCSAGQVLPKRIMLIFPPVWTEKGQERPRVTPTTSPAPTTLSWAVHPPSLTRDCLSELRPLPLWRVWALGPQGGPAGWRRWAPGRWKSLW